MSNTLTTTEAIVRTLTWAFGGGRQSVAIAILIKQGRLPLPEYIGMADTGYERVAVWEYNERYTFPLLAELGTAVDVIPHSYATVDIEGHNGDLLLPVFTDTGKLPTFCSNEWKQRVYNRRLRELGYGPKRPVTKWLGFSLEEYDRMKTTGLQWIENAFPLLMGYERRYYRHELEQLILDYGWPLPPKSACDFCPNRDNATWQVIKDNEPDTFQKAVGRDKWLREPEQVGKWGETYLHGSLIPLDEVDFSSTEKGLPLFDLCGASCFT